MNRPEADSARIDVSCMRLILQWHAVWLMHTDYHLTLLITMKYKSRGLNAKPLALELGDLRLSYLDTEKK